MPHAEEILSQYTSEQLWQKFDTLPEGLKDAILSPQTLDNLDIIASTHNLPIIPNTLVRYTHAVLAGIIPVQNFRKTLQEELDLDENGARTIAYEIRDKIFAPVAEDLRMLNHLPLGEQTAPAPAQQTVVQAMAINNYIQDIQPPPNGETNA